MARKGRKHKRQARRQALDAAAAAAVAKPSTPPPTSPRVSAAPAPARSADETQPVRIVREPAASPTAPGEAAVPVADAAPAQRRRRAAVWPLVGAAAAAVFGLAILAAFLLDDPAQQAAPSASADIVVGVPGGEITSQETPAPTPTPTSQPTEQPTPEPTAATPRPTPTVTATTRPATPLAATPVPATPVPAAPDPTPVIVAVAQPEDAVAAFYANVAEGDFDAAYALWSDRMKATYSREGNLDERFDDTASITFHQLQVAGQDGGTAVVQANFTETYDSGGSREFVGYWELIRVDGRWLLDAPHY